MLYVWSQKKIDAKNESQVRKTDWHRHIQQQQQPNLTNLNQSCNTTKFKSRDIMIFSNVLLESLDWPSKKKKSVLFEIYNQQQNGIVFFEKLQLPFFFVIIKYTGIVDVFFLYRNLVQISNWLILILSVCFCMVFTVCNLLNDIV